MKSYELFLHYKQGDDLGALVEEHPGNIPEALRSWAAHFKHNAAICERLATAFKGQNLDVHADTHHIEFCPSDEAAVRCLEVLHAEKLIDVFTYDDEDDYDDA